MKKALLFINGEPPKTLPDLSGYDLIACSDGAFHYLKEKNFPLEKLSFISGDFDSHCHSELEVYTEQSRSEESETLRQAQRDKTYKFEIIETPDQNKTDFHKALEIIFEKGFENIDIFGASGGEQDHFLGNLSTAFFFKDRLNITFFDDFSSYFFIPKKFSLHNVKGKMISLLPFPVAKNIETKGLKWALNNENLVLGKRIGTRNVAENDDVFIEYQEGDLLIFVGC